MTESLSFSMFSGVVGGLAIFLLGMKYMSDGLQAIAGDRLRRIIRSVTNNRLIGVGAGFGATCIVQSSSVTTVLVIGMVSAGLMTLTQSIGVILGADIGTTITAWIVALDVFVKGGVLIFGLPLIGLSGFFYLFAKGEKTRFVSMIVMGLGMIFFGLHLMKTGVKPLRTMPEFQVWFSQFSPETLLGVLACVLIGAVLTGIIQSSSATVGITMVLAKDGVIDMQTALALVIGENVGTTITAYLASLVASSEAKRSAYAHILIKFGGSLWAIPILWLGMQGLLNIVGPEAMVARGWVSSPSDGAMLGIALFHTGFNILNVTLFLPFTEHVARLLTRITPCKSGDDRHLVYMDVALLATPAVGIQQSKDTIVRMGEICDAMLGQLLVLLKSERIADQQTKLIYDGEEKLDVIQGEVVMFLSRLLAGTVSIDIMEHGRGQLRAADEYESVSDYIARILKMHQKLQNNGAALSKESKNRIIDLHGRVATFVSRINEAVKTDDNRTLADAKDEADAIMKTMKDYRDEHLRTFAHEASPLASLVFTDSLTAYRRIRSHTLNIAQAAIRDQA